MNCKMDYNLHPSNDDRIPKVNITTHKPVTGDSPIDGWVTFQLLIPARDDRDAFTVDVTVYGKDLQKCAEWIRQIPNALAAALDEQEDRTLEEHEDLPG